MIYGKTIVEELICNFDTKNFSQHNHGLKEKVKVEQLALDFKIKIQSISYYQAFIEGK